MNERRFVRSIGEIFVVLRRVLFWASLIFTVGAVFTPLFTYPARNAFGDPQVITTTLFDLMTGYQDDVYRFLQDEGRVFFVFQIAAFICLVAPIVILASGPHGLLPSELKRPPQWRVYVNTAAAIAAVISLPISLLGVTELPTGPSHWQYTPTWGPAILCAALAILTSTAHARWLPPVAEELTADD